MVDLFITLNHQFKPTPTQLATFFATAVAQPRLHSLLLNRADWALTGACTDWLLSDSARSNATAALDFIWAAQRLPMLWRGRELAAERCQEYLMMLTLDQIKVLVEYIVKEVRTDNDFQTRVNQLIYFLKGNCQSNN